MLYCISYQNPHLHFVDFELTIDTKGAQTIDLQLAAWRPGRYELQNFAKNIQKFSVKNSEGEKLFYQKKTKDCWAIQCQNSTQIIVSYTYYAAKLDAGNSWLDASQLYLNFVNCVFAVVGREDEAYQIELQIPDNYLIACSLAKKDKTLFANNYEELADSPMIASASLRHGSYEANNCTFHIWIQGEALIDWSLIIKQFSAFTQVQIDIFGEIPTEHYHFLCQITPFPFYHGVEHLSSTVLALGASESFHQAKLQKDFLGIASHELFHMWNIKKIRPLELSPYDYTKENYFPTGFVAEGVTSYYGDYLLARSGVFSESQYLEELNLTLKREYENFGRHQMSVAEASFDLWLDGYEAGIPWRKSSIYVKGALVALMLDLELRLLTQNRNSLDDLMRLLWQNFGKTGRGYTLEDYINLADELAGCSLSVFFDDFVLGTKEIHPKLSDQLLAFGYTLTQVAAMTWNEFAFGFRVEPRNGALVVSSIAPDSPAAQVLSLEDELIAVNHQKIKSFNFYELLDTKEEISLTLFRNQLLTEVFLKKGEKEYFSSFKIEKISSLTDFQENNFKLWLEKSLK